MVAAADSFLIKHQPEKVFLHTDRGHYTNTDTIWIKAYLLNSALEYSEKSGLLYTELVNDTGKVAKRIVLPLEYGLGFGQMALDSNTLPEGNYILRAYTNWMQNIGEGCFFTRPVYIGNVNTNRWLVKTSSRINGTDNAEVGIQVLDTDNSPVRLRDMRLSLTDSRKTWLNENMTTDMAGMLHFNFDIPQGAGIKQLNIVARELNPKGEARKLVIPVHINRPDKIDVQFMPEGGHLVAGLTSKIGFKAVGEDLSLIHI